MRIEVMRGAFTGGGATVAGGRLTTSGGRTTGTTRVISVMRLEPLPRTPSPVLPTTPPDCSGPPRVASGGSTIATARGGALGSAGSIRVFLMEGGAAARDGIASGFGPGGGGAGGAPGATSPVTRNARPRVCGDTSGANIKQPISTACPVNPMAVVQTLLEDGS